MAQLQTDEWDDAARHDEGWKLLVTTPPSIIFVPIIYTDHIIIMMIYILIANEFGIWINKAPSMLRGCT